MESQKIILLLIILVICGITDVLKQKVYNIITLPGIVAGFFLNFHYHSWPGLLDSFFGFLICSVIFIIFFMWGGFGAGDVKLMMAIGTFTGSKIIIDVIFYSVIAGGIIANIVIIKNRNFIKSWKRVFRFFLFLIPKYHLKSEPLQKENSISIPYAYAISIGTLVYMYFNF